MLWRHENIWRPDDEMRCSRVSWRLLDKRWARTAELAGRRTTFDVSHDDHDEEAVVVGVVGVVDAGGDLASADHLLQGDQHQLDRQEGHALVEEVEGAVKDQVPVREAQHVDGICRLSLLFLCCFCLPETIISNIQNGHICFFFFQMSHILHVDPTDVYDVYLSSVYLNLCRVPKAAAGLSRYFIVHGATNLSFLVNVRFLNDHFYMFCIV